MLNSVPRARAARASVMVPPWCVAEGETNQETVHRLSLRMNKITRRRLSGTNIAAEKKRRKPRIQSSGLSTDERHSAVSSY